MLSDDFDEGSKFRIIFSCRNVRVMQLQELPGCVGIGEGRVEKVDLGLRCIVAGCCVGVEVNGGVLILSEWVNEAKEEGR